MNDTYQVIGASRVSKRVADSSNRNPIKVFQGASACTIDPPGPAITFDPYPAVPEFTDFPGQVQQFFVVTQLPIPPNAQCPPVPTLTKVQNSQDLAKVSAKLGGPTYVAYRGLRTQNQEPYTSSDHVWEKKLLKLFIEHALKNLGVDCAEFNTFFMAASGKLQHLYSYLPNNNYPDFAAMDEYINTSKGTLFTGEWQIPRTGTAQLERLIQYGLAAAVIKHPDIITLFQRSHERIYGAFLDIDDQLNQCGGLASLKIGWAAAYQAWLSNLLRASGLKSQNVASQYYQDLSGRGVDTVPARALYPPDYFLFPSAAMVALPQNPPRFPIKRADSCPITPMPSPSRTSTPSPSSTSTGGSAIPTGSIQEGTPTENYCVAENNADGYYKAYNGTSLRESLNTFCSAGYVLTPENNDGFVVRVNTPDSIVVYAIQKWAKNQSGCAPKKSIALKDMPCRDEFAQAIFTCDEFGGATTADSESGCIVTESYALAA